MALASAGWSHLADAVRANGQGLILGYGKLASGGNLAYLLTPTSVPEPGTLLLFAAGLGGLALTRRRAIAGARSAAIRS